MDEMATNDVRGGERGVAIYHGLPFPPLKVGQWSRPQAYGTDVLRNGLAQTGQFVIRSAFVSKASYRIENGCKKGSFPGGNFG